MAGVAGRFGALRGPPHRYHRAAPGFTAQIVGLWSTGLALRRRDDGQIYRFKP